MEKELYISFIDVSSKYKVRDLKTASIGTLFQISGQVIRTHPVHPELVSATFVCLDCQTVIKDVEQQFKVSLANILYIISPSDPRVLLLHSTPSLPCAAIPFASTGLVSC